MTQKIPPLYYAAISAISAIRIREVFPDIQFYHLETSELVKPHKEYPGNPAHYERLRKDEQ